MLNSQWLSTQPHRSRFTSVAERNCSTETGRQFSCGSMRGMLTWISVLADEKLPRGPDSLFYSGICHFGVIICFWEVQFLNTGVGHCDMNNSPDVHVVTATVANSKIGYLKILSSYEMDGQAVSKLNPPVRTMEARKSVHNSYWFDQHFP